MNLCKGRLLLIKKKIWMERQGGRGVLSVFFYYSPTYLIIPDIKKKRIYWFLYKYTYIYTYMNIWMKNGFYNIKANLLSLNFYFIRFFKKWICCTYMTLFILTNYKSLNEIESFFLPRVAEFLYIKGYVFWWKNKFFNLYITIL